jgi:hypothetical protein
MDYHGMDLRSCSNNIDQCRGATIMTARQYIRGHPIEYKDSRWVFSDNGEPVRGGNGERACVRCGELPTLDGHDACIANLPDVRAACCGHGVHTGYISYENGDRKQLHIKNHSDEYRQQLGATREFREKDIIKEYKGEVSDGS